MRGVLLFSGFAVALTCGCNTPVPGVDSGPMDSATAADSATDSGMAPDITTTDAGCATPLTTQANCGTCGHACTSGQVCTMGMCSPLGLSWVLPVVSPGSTRLYGGALRPDGDLMIFGELRGDLTTIGSAAAPSDLAFVAGADGYLADVHPTPTSATPIWVRNIVGPGTESFRTITIDDASNVVTLGGFTSGASTTIGALTSAGLDDFCAVSFAAGGGPRWQVTEGGTGSDGPTGGVIDEAGRTHALVNISGTATIAGAMIASDGPSDMVLVEISSSGIPGHVLRLDTSGDDRADIAVAPDGSLWVALTFTGTLMLGVGGMPTASGQDIALVHLTDETSGYVVHSVTVFTGPGDQAGQYSGGIAVAPDGRVAVLARSTMPWDPGMGSVGHGALLEGQVLVLDAAGQLVAVHEFTSDGIDEPQVVTFDSEGNLYASARVSSATTIVIDGVMAPAVGTRDAVLASWDASQNLRFSRVYGRAGSSGEMTFIAPDPTHHALYVGGDSIAGMTVEGMTVDADEDGWIARLTY